MAGPRRVRKRSVSTYSLLPTYVALLEPLQLDLQASVDKKDSPQFTLQVQRRKTSTGSQSPQSIHWSCSRPFEDFETLHQKLELALQHGHFCNAGCPWLFSFLSSHFPTKNIFQRRFSVRAVETRRGKLLALLNGVMEFLLDRKNHSCSVAATDVAKPFAEFLYGEQQIAQFIVESYSDEAGTNSSRRRSPCPCVEDDDNETNSTGACVCGVCKGSLMCEPDTGDNDFADSTSPADSSSRRRSSVFATSLHCGHQFHDECIVPVLNKTLRCPTCQHQEIQP